MTKLTAYCVTRLASSASDPACWVDAIGDNAIASIACVTAAAADLCFLVATCNRTRVPAMAVYDSTPIILDQRLIRLRVARLNPRRLVLICLANSYAAGGVG
jgi:hypothetical protein